MVMVMNEDLSRLMDGDLDDADVDRVLDACREPRTLAIWACYHVIGDALRGASGAVAMPRRLERALAAEPTILAPRARMPKPVASWAWAAAATIAAVTVVGWTAVTLTETPGTAVAKAREAAGVTAAQVRPQVLPQDYVLVHQEYSPATALQGVRPYVRAVSTPIGEQRP
jgi:sigma-E factor negative regulatory protein RseA